MNVLRGRRARVRAVLAMVAGTAGLALIASPALAVDPDTFVDDPNAGTSSRRGTLTSTTKQPPGSRWPAALAKQSTWASWDVRFTSVLKTR